MELKRVVVTGLGALTPIGNDVPTLWESLVAGVSGGGPITHFDTTKFRTKIAAELKGFDPLEHFDRKEMRLLDGYTVYGLVAVEEALRDAGLTDETIDKARMGVVWGSGMGGVTSLQDEIIEYATHDRTPRFSPYWVPKVIIDICAGQIAIRYGLLGPNYCTAAACASSAAAISGIIADEAAIGVVNNKTTAVRVIPAVGKKAGDRVEFGGLLGFAPVMPVNTTGNEAFIARGGRIPAPLHSLRN
jgi:3-oxoacyl-[acyl-carrier-protein] synthase II